MATSFGVVITVKDTSESSVIGVLQDLTVSDGVDVAVSRDAANDVDAYQTSGRIKKLSASFVYDSTYTTSIIPGNILLVGTERYLLTKVETRETNTSYRRVNIEATRWAGNGLPKK